MNLSRFFSKWFFIAIILILLGLMLSSTTQTDQTLKYIVSLFSGLLQNIGLSIIIGCIFDFIIGTEDFIKYIRERLVDIVLSKDFITKLNENEQKRLLKLTLKPTREVSSIYSGIDDYFDTYVNKSMELFETCYRGQMTIDAIASIDKERNVIKIEWDITYLVYRVAEKFEPLLIWVSDDNTEHVETTITANKNDIERINNNSLIDIDKSKIQDPILNKGYTIEFPERFNRFREVTIRRKLIEYGNNHWHLFCYKAMKPCHRITVNISCHDGIIIKDVNTFGVQDEFSIENNKHKVRIAYND